MFLLKVARKIYSTLKRTNDENKYLPMPLDYSGQAASDLIKNKLAAPDPCMICRFGTSELNATVAYLNINRKSEYPFEKSINYILENNSEFWWSKGVTHGLGHNAGFFPITNQSLEAFSNRMLKDVENVDILGSWITGETKISNFMKEPTIVRLKDLEPYYHVNPWSEVLENKIVLVIHPFEDSIKMQYEKRKLLFKDERTLPQFELKTLKSIQSIAGNITQFDTWFDALDYMCEQISNMEFDIAIIGAGAYGLPLASYVKKIGKKSVHLGGATQLLFGIKGNRWDNSPFFQDLYNQYWMRPSPTEIPNNHKSVEGGSYW